jgi:hypothetical protein
MAQDIGLLLRGLGAAVSNQVPQFRQQMMADQENQMRQQEFQAQQEQRMRQAEMQNFERMRTLQAAGYQDALALTELLKPESLNVEGALGLLEDRMALMDQMDMKIPNDPTRMIYDNLRRYAGSGDTAAFNTARNTAGALVVQGVARGDIKLPEVQRDKGVVVNGRVVNPYSGDVIAEFPTEAAAPTPQSPIGKLQSDIAAGLIPSELGQQLITAEMAAAQRAQAEAEQSTRAATNRQQLENEEALQALSLTESLIDNPNLKSAVGSIQGQYIPSLRAGTVDAEVKLGELKNLLTLGNLGRMTGVLTDRDIELLASAASGLDIRMSDAAVVAKLNEIKSRLVMRLKEKGLIRNDYGTPGVVTGQVQRDETPAPRVINGYTITEIRGG